MKTHVPAELTLSQAAPRPLLPRVILLAVFLARCALLGAGPKTCSAASSPESSQPPAATLDLTREQLLDHIRGGWTGMLIGGIEGLAHEFKYIQEPRPELPDYKFLADTTQTELAGRRCLDVIRARP